MERGKDFIRMVAAVVVCIGVFLFTSHHAAAHCDTLDGPVVAAARGALEKGDVAPVLKWVKAEHEGEIREAFKRTMAVRKQGKEARGLAELYFFETLVRIHRAGEKAPYTGLKPAGVVEPAVAAADKALESGSADNLVKLVTEAAAAGIRERFARAGATKKQADESVAAGRDFVEAYVEFTHYAERLHLDAVGHPPLHDEPEEGTVHGGHAH